MNTKVIEIQAEGKTREYNIEGPERDTVVSFWDYLKAQGVIEDYRVDE